jgi:parallel beta-helix repeat protein
VQRLETNYPLAYMVWTALVLLVLAPASGAQPQGAEELVVSPNGRDDGPGNREHPFATVARAKSAVRERIAAGLQGNVTVLLRAGGFELDEPLVFGPEDSGTERHSITYAAFPGERPVLSGGRKLTGWKRGEGNLWTLEVPGAKSGKGILRQLFVNGRRATRARTPNLEHPPGVWTLTNVHLKTDPKSFALGLAPGLLKEYGNISDVEVVVLSNWEILRKRLARVDAAEARAILAPPYPDLPDWYRDYLLPRTGMACYFENALEMLDQPGEWYLDRKTGILSYWPREGEDMTRAETVVSFIPKLVELAGTSKAPIRNLHFKGLTFSHADSDLPAPGYYGVQACHALVGEIARAIRWSYAESCSLTDSRLTNLGGVAVELWEGCSRNLLEGNLVSDVGGSGIMIGVGRDNKVANNHIRGCGATFHGGVGIWVGLADGTVVSHNLVHDLPYTGISVGWQWNAEPTTCKNNRMEHNHIYDVMKMLADGGGIYTLGLQPGTVLSGNLIHDVHRSSFAAGGAPNNGIFFDEGSRGFRVEGNVIYDTSGEAIRFNQCRAEDHAWGKNAFGARPGVPGKFGLALACNGATSYLEAPHARELEPLEMTVEAWIQAASFPSGEEPRRWIVNKNANEWTEGHYALMIDKNNAGAYLNIGGGQGNCFAAFSTSGPLKPNRWHHLAMTYDGSTLRVFVDGAPAASSEIRRKRTPGQGPLSIGRRQDGYNYFGGLIDEVKLYSRPLSPEEIRQHAAADAPADPKRDPGLAGYWSFDEGDPLVGKTTPEAGLEPKYRTALPGSE